MFETIGLNLNPPVLHSSQDLEVKELGTLISTKGSIYICFDSEEIAAECQVFFKNNLGLVCCGGYFNAIRLA